MADPFEAQRSQTAETHLPYRGDAGAVPAASARTLASPGQRFVAALLDGVFELILAMIPVVGLPLLVAYSLAKDAFPFLGGQSLGKRAMGIRVVRENGEPITGDYATSVIRQLPLWVPLFQIVDALMVFREDRRRFGDRWATTRVVVEDA